MRSRRWPRLQPRAQRKGSLRIYYANVTKWGPKAKGYLLDLDMDVIVSVETHVKRAELDKQKHEVAKKGWRSVWAPAVETSDHKDGSMGGVVILARSHLECSLSGAAMDGGVAVCNCGHDWVVALIRLRGTWLALGGIYLKDSIGIVSENVEKLLGLEACLKQLRAPFLVLGDHNVKPTEYGQSGWAGRLGAEVLVPEGATATCTTGEGGLLDFALRDVRLHGEAVGLCLDPYLLGSPTKGSSLWWTGRRAPFSIWFRGYLLSCLGSRLLLMWI